MTTSAFQWIVDKAESIAINRKHMVAQTQARDGSIRAVSRGLAPKIFTVKLPDGMLWTDIKDFIAATEAADRFTQQTITISNPGQAWYYGSGYTATNMPSNLDSWTVYLVTYPDWSIYARNSVSWSGPFVFVEVPQ
jgi:hypothetical protein